MVWIWKAKSTRKKFATHSKSPKLGLQSVLLIPLYQLFGNKVVQACTQDAKASCFPSTYKKSPDGGFLYVLGSRLELLTPRSSGECSTNWATQASEEQSVERFAFRRKFVWQSLLGQTIFSMKSNVASHILSECHLGKLRLPSDLTTPLPWLVALLYLFLQEYQWLFPSQNKEELLQKTVELIELVETILHSSTWP